MKNGGWRIPAGKAAMIILEEFTVLHCTVLYCTVLYLLMVLWLGEYQALTMAGCMSHTSRCGASLSVTRSCLAAQLRITTALLKKLSPSG